MQNPFVQLAEIRRGPAVESIHHGIAVVMDSEGRQVLAMGDPAFVTFPRSSLKPYQAVALVETGAADARGRYEIPNVGKAVVVNAAPTKEVWDARRTAEGKNLRDGKREYLGVEKKRTQSGIDPATLGEWRGTGETMTNTGTAVEKYSNMKTLSIEDVRELLNKNK